jgi:hypothetical protein
MAVAAAHSSGNSRRTESRGSKVAGKHGFSGPRQSSAQPTATPFGARRHVRVGPPANDNVRLGGLRFTGLRIAVACFSVIALLAILRGTGAI